MRRSFGFLKWTLIGVIFIYIGIQVFALFIVPREQLGLLRDYQRVETSFIDGRVSYQVEKEVDNWVILSDVNPLIVEIFVISEDGRFWKHHGFNLTQIRKALRDYFIHDEKLRGASTISQQLTKNLFLTKDRTLGRKLKEALITRELEEELSKKQILEIYLNVIEYGEGLYGIGNASEFYFDKLPSELTLKEGAFLAMLLPNPKVYSESFYQNKLTTQADSLINKILNQAYKKRKIDGLKLSEALNEKLSFEE